jgi:hypothetical protein
MRIVEKGLVQVEVQSGKYQDIRPTFLEVIKDLKTEGYHSDQLRDLTPGSPDVFGHVVKTFELNLTFPFMAMANAQVGKDINASDLYRTHAFYEKNKKGILSVPMLNAIVKHEFPEDPQGWAYTKSFAINIGVGDVGEFAVTMTRIINLVLMMAATVLSKNDTIRMYFFVDFTLPKWADRQIAYGTAEQEINRNPKIAIDLV